MDVHTYASTDIILLSKEKNAAHSTVHDVSVGFFFSSFFTCKVQFRLMLFKNL